MIEEDVLLWINKIPKTIQNHGASAGKEKTRKQKQNAKNK